MFAMTYQLKAVRYENISSYTKIILEYLRLSVCISLRGNLGATSKVVVI